MRGGGGRRKGGPLCHSVLLLLVCVTGIFYLSIFTTLQQFNVQPHHSPDYKREAIKQVSDQSLFVSKSVLLRTRALFQAFLHAWSNYEYFAFGADELEPLSRKGHSWDYHHSSMGATIIDSLGMFRIFGIVNPITK